MSLLNSLYSYILFFLVIYFSWNKEYMISLISVSQFSDVLPAFTSASAIGNL